MAPLQIAASAAVAAPADEVYNIIADYRNGHPHILPKPPFVSLDVESGGVGAGTRIRFVMRVLGRNYTIRAVVTEPEPGRVLVETNDNNFVSTFTVEPRDGGQSAYVTIASDTTVSDGLLGKLQGWLFTRLLQPTYVREIAQLEQFAQRSTAR